MTSGQVNESKVWDLDAEEFKHHVRELSLNCVVALRFLAEF